MIIILLILYSLCVYECSKDQMKHSNKIKRKESSIEYTLIEKMFSPKIDYDDIHRFLEDILVSEPMISLEYLINCKYLLKDNTLLTIPILFEDKQKLSFIFIAILSNNLKLVNFFIDKYKKEQETQKSKCEIKDCSHRPLSIINTYALFYTSKHINTEILKLICNNFKIHEAHIGKLPIIKPRVNKIKIALHKTSFVSLIFHDLVQRCEIHSVCFKSKLNKNIDDGINTNFEVYTDTHVHRKKIIDIILNQNYINCCQNIYKLFRLKLTPTVNYSKSLGIGYNALFISLNNLMLYSNINLNVKDHKNFMFYDYLVDHKDLWRLFFPHVLRHLLKISFIQNPKSFKKTLKTLIKDFQIDTRKLTLPIYNDHNKFKKTLPWYRNYTKKKKYKRIFNRYTCANCGVSKYTGRVKKCKKCNVHYTCDHIKCPACRNKKYQNQYLLKTCQYCQNVYCNNCLNNIHRYNSFDKIESVKYSKIEFTKIDSKYLEKTTYFNIHDLYLRLPGYLVSTHGVLTINCNPLFKGITLNIFHYCILCKCNHIVLSPRWHNFDHSEYNSSSQFLAQCDVCKRINYCTVSKHKSIGKPLKKCCKYKYCSRKCQKIHWKYKHRYNHKT